MLVTTGFDIEGKQIAEYLGVVRGIVVRATGLGRGIIGGIKSLAGGNIEEWSVVCEAARMEAFNRLVQHAHEIGADAIIGMRYDATEFSQGATEVLAYGTAVKLK
ncbi:MAG: YbjQ family protein [Pyrinomonadaceae bacterium]